MTRSVQLPSLPFAIPSYKGGQKNSGHCGPPLLQVLLLSTLSWIGFGFISLSPPHSPHQ